MLRSVARERGFSVDTPFKDLSPEIRKMVLYGEGRGWGYFEGVIPNLERRFRETESEYVKNEINKYMSVLPCPECGGKRLKPETLAVTICGKNIYDVSCLSVRDAKSSFPALISRKMRKK
jgi:excinuclease ABC subunit A